MSKKRYILFGAAIVLLLGLSQCHSGNERIEGVWQLKVMEVNGVKLQGTSLGNWMWEFNDAGGYLADIAGMREKGAFILNGDQLTLKHAADRHLPDQVYKIEKLDTVELDLVSTDPVNKSTMHFIKRNVRDVAAGEKD